VIKGRSLSRVSLTGQNDLPFYRSTRVAAGNQTSTANSIAMVTRDSAVDIAIAALLRETKVR
jgi:hypothetical protein